MRWTSYDWRAKNGPVPTGHTWTLLITQPTAYSTFQGCYYCSLCFLNESQILPICEMTSPAVAAAKAYLASVDLSSYDPEQSRLMQERCILVDENDNAIGAVDKKTCVSANFSPCARMVS